MQENLRMTLPPVQFQVVTRLPSRLLTRTRNLLKMGKALHITSLVYIVRDIGSFRHNGTARFYGFTNTALRKRLACFPREKFTTFGFATNSILFATRPTASNCLE
mmetsp:Transcript_30004/g.49159  ORF Transcript_30004/g.49159 Transcript_30004/m.49159 type:complete len:105 (-) Transcript_30004:554-868(-)